MGLRPDETTPGADDPSRTEHQRIREVYENYASSAKHRRIWTDTPASRFMQEGKWARIAGLLEKAQFDPQAGICLDLGSGGGDECRWILGIGVPRDRLVGIDLLEKHLRQARRGLPWLSLIQGDASRLPFREGSLAFVYQSTMLSSVLDGVLRRAMLEEVVRVLRPGGIFLSYDTRYPNPWNPNTRPLGARELRAAFAGWRMWIQSANGIPQLIRLLAPLSITLCRMVERVPFLRSHLLVAARKPAA